MFHISTIYQRKLVTQEKIKIKINIDNLSDPGWREEKQEDTLTGCPGEFGQYCKFKQTLTDQSKLMSSMWSQWDIQSSTTTPP